MRFCPRVHPILLGARKSAHNPPTPSSRGRQRTCLRKRQERRYHRFRAPGQVCSGAGRRVAGETRQQDISCSSLHHHTSLVGSDRSRCFCVAVRQLFSSWYSTVVSGVKIETPQRWDVGALADTSAPGALFSTACNILARGSRSRGKSTYTSPRYEYPPNGSPPARSSSPFIVPILTTLESKCLESLRRDSPSNSPWWARHL